MKNSTLITTLPAVRQDVVTRLWKMVTEIMTSFNNSINEASVRILVETDVSWFSQLPCKFLSIGVSKFLLHL
jgi:hypothetical protein